jgi:hypothetical protein
VWTLTNTGKLLKNNFWKRFQNKKSEANCPTPSTLDHHKV